MVYSIPIIYAYDIDNYIEKSKNKGIDIKRTDTILRMYVDNSKVVRCRKRLNLARSSK